MSLLNDNGGGESAEDGRGAMEIFRCIPMSFTCNAGNILSAIIMSTKIRIPTDRNTQTIPCTTLQLAIG